jgi:hypothetical protein
MSEFYEMLKEAIVGAEPYRPDEGRAALEASVRKFEARLRTVRFMAIFAVSFATVAWIAGLVLLVRADDSVSPRELLLYAGLAVFGFAIVGFAKMWFANMMNHLTVMKELKAVELRVLELSRETPSP